MFHCQTEKLWIQPDGWPGRGDPCLTTAHNRGWGLGIPTCQVFWPRYTHCVSGMNSKGIFCGWWLACTWLPLDHCWGPICSTQYVKITSIWYVSQVTGFEVTWCLHFQGAGLGEGGYDINHYHEYLERSLLILFSKAASLLSWTWRRHVAPKHG